MDLFRTKAQAEAALADRALRDVVAAMHRSQAVIEFELDGTIITANENFLVALGYTLAEVKGRPHSMFVDPDLARSPAYGDFWRTLRTGRFMAAKYPRIAKSGATIWIQASYNPVLDGTGKPYKVIKFATDITAHEEERAKTDLERRAGTEIQDLVVTSLAGALSRLAESDLTARIDADLGGRYEQIKTDFNTALDGLHKTIRTVSDTVEALHAGTSEITRASDDLSRRTEQQAASLEETAAALDEITATVRKTADGAKHTREVVMAARRDAEASGTVVRQAEAAMASIQASSKEISQIIGVIDEIAFQTNLLALNAGVEAARAGEAGRGFAVVASEVRALAQRSAEAAKEIKALISTSSTHVTSGAELVGATGKALGRIIDQVSDIAGVVNEIAASAQEQATALQEVNTAINGMDQTTQQNAAMVEQSTAASHSLAQDTERLSHLVGAFQMGDHPVQRAAPRTPRRAPVRSAAAPTPHRPSRGTFQPVATRGHLALKMPAPDGWEEF